MSENYLLSAAKAAKKKNITKALNVLLNHAYSKPDIPLAEAAERLREDYQRMVSYWADGYDDPELEKVHDELAMRVYATTVNAMMMLMRRGKCKEYTIGTFEALVTEAAIIDLEPTELRQAKKKTFYRRRQEVMTDVFKNLAVAEQWTDKEMTEYHNILLSPTVDVNDRCLIISALTLNICELMDYRKLLTLIDVYMESEEEKVAQRALVGWVTTAESAPLFPMIERRVKEVLRNEKVVEDVVSLQIQMLYCMNTKSDVDKLQNDIIPDIMKSHHIRIDSEGIKEEAEDSMEDILNTASSEEQMARAEESYYKMQKMQADGVDIYYGGFSQMKRFPFFNDIANWFLSYYPEQADVAEILEDERSATIIGEIISGSSFCDSDKYSFTLAFKTMLERIPENMRKVLLEGKIYENLKKGKEYRNVGALTVADIRREYLQDLYRFYNVSTHGKVFQDPFKLFVNQDLYRDTAVSEHYQEIANTLFRKGRFKGAAELYDLSGVVPEDNVTLYCYGRALFFTRQFERAYEAFTTLVKREPKNKSYRICKALGGTMIGRYEEIEPELFQLDYEYPNEMEIMRPLGDCLLKLGKYKQALSVYERIVEIGRREEILEGLALAYWYTGNRREAAKTFNDMQGQGKTFGNRRYDGFDSIDMDLMSALMEELKKGSEEV